jgi:hypothetical protein
MEYGSDIMPVDLPCDDNYMKHVGYTENNPCIKYYFHPSQVKTISHKITELLQGVDPQGRPIIVPDKTICSIMSEVYDSYRPPTGDIYGRYNVPSGNGFESYVQSMIDQVIEIIVSDVRINMGMEEYNKSLSIWSTVYGDFNEHKLRQHPPIKILSKRPTPLQFNMKY